MRVGFGAVRRVFTRRACLRSDLKQRKEPAVRRSGGKSVSGSAADAKALKSEPVLQTEGRAGLVPVEQRV